MPEESKHLAFDFSFLEAPKAELTPPPPLPNARTRSRGQIPWPKILVAGVVGVIFLLWLISDKTPPNQNSGESHSSPSNYSAPSTPYSQPNAYDSSSVQNGQYTCSSDDSRQADSMMPSNGTELDAETNALNARSAQLDLLKGQIDGSTINQYSNQSSIDGYNELVAQYNAQLASFKTDYASHQRRIIAYNEQIQEHNNYLETHCRASR